MIRVTSVATHRRSGLVHSVHPGEAFTSCGRWLGRPAWKTADGDIQAVMCESCLTVLATYATRRRAAA